MREMEKVKETERMGDGRNGRMRVRERKEAVIEDKEMEEQVDTRGKLRMEAAEGMGERRNRSMRGRGNKR